jgi:hypothetical protein
MYAQYVDKVLMLPENKIVAARCKCTAVRLEKVVLALSDFSDKIN